MRSQREKVRELEWRLTEALLATARLSEIKEAYYDCLATCFKHWECHSLLLVVEAGEYEAVKWVASERSEIELLKDQCIRSNHPTSGLLRPEANEEGVAVEWRAPEDERFRLLVLGSGDEAEIQEGLGILGPLLWQAYVVAEEGASLDSWSVASLVERRSSVPQIGMTRLEKSLDRELLDSFEREDLQRTGVLPLFCDEEGVVVAAVRPDQEWRVQELEMITKRPLMVRYVIAARDLELVLSEPDAPDDGQLRRAIRKRLEQDSSAIPEILRPLLGHSLQSLPNELLVQLAREAESTKREGSLLFSDLRVLGLTPSQLAELMEQWAELRPGVHVLVGPPSRTRDRFWSQMQEQLAQDGLVVLGQGEPEGLAAADLQDLVAGEEGSRKAVYVDDLCDDSLFEAAIDAWREGVAVFASIRALGIEQAHQLLRDLGHNEGLDDNLVSMCGVLELDVDLVVLQSWSPGVGLRPGSLHELVSDAPKEWRVPAFWLRTLAALKEA